MRVVPYISYKMASFYQFSKQEKLECGPIRNVNFVGNLIRDID